ncbi:MAG: hemagglutinin repeat-containing protein [Veillonella sp.]|uniref:hemagglutinin repeat-containing protein n=1 Tax=Veillonella TaxID=29465 RepID=UPI0029064476|nr:MULTISPECIES: hemagglutinin repeat-containing protein [Veillonella]MDU3413788.1 hemagglutinin repeat-containing protein [Veillonella parvula]MDU6971824.1 hemagglutinin repeat-containing protein [Veillonella sp.]
MQSDTTIYQQGQIVGRDAVELQAKENITFNNSIEHLTNQDVLHKTAGIAVTGDSGVMIVSAGNDVNLGGATIEALGKEGAITITAGRDINSTTDTLTAKKDMTQDGDNYLRTYRQTELSTTIEAGGNVSIGAKNDIKARNLTISSDSGAVKVIGEHDVSIENGYSESKDAFALKYKEKGLLNKKETKIKTNDESKNALMSTVSGHTVVVGANNDVTLTSSNVVSTAGTSVLAGHDVITDAAAEHTLSTASKDVKKSGIMGAGMGIMIGKKQSKDNYYIDETTHKATTLGSTNGEVTVQAGDTVHLTTTNTVGKDGVVIVGQDIILDGKDDLYKQEERHERKSSGLTVSLGGSVVEKIDSAVKKQHSASDRRNSHFKSLEGKQSIERLFSAIGEAKQIVDRSYNGQMRAINSQLEHVNADIVNTPETDSTKLAELKAKQELLLKKRTTLEENKGIVNKATDRAVDRAVNIQVGIGSSKSVAESKLERYTYSSGAIDSDGTILLHANSADSIKGNITAIGEQIKGKTVQLTASNTINLEAGSNTQRVETNSKSSGWNVSANIGMRTGGLVGWSASTYKGTENGVEDTTTHTGTHVVGSNNVFITSGNDTNLIGSTISGKGVAANVGNNLSVESLQDSQIYHEISKNKGISISGANFISQPMINGANVKGNIDSSYKSVTEQSGIYAGSDGVNIVVGDTTTLKGAIITSKATPEKNKISTKSLVMEDIHNEASYKAKKSGIAMNTSGLTAKGILGKINPLGLSPVVSIPVSDEAQSTTKSAISDAILVEVEGKTLTTINRDTEHALNSIKPIFDKADVKERMEYVNAISDEGFKLIGDVAMKQAQKYEEKAANTSDEALKKRYQKEADKWKDGGIYKVALHGGFGAVVSNMAGGSSLDGLATASANEIMVGTIAEELAKHPNSTINADGKYVDNSDVYKIASAILGNTVSHSSLGTGISLSATTSNYLTHEQGKQYEYELSLAKSEKERKLVIQKWKAIDEKQEADYISQEKSIFKKYFNTISDLIDFNIYLPYKRERNRYNISLDRAFSLDSNTGKLKEAMVKVISLPLKEESSFAERIQNEKNIFALNRAEIISKIEGFEAGSDEFDENTLYHYNRIRVGEDKLLSHILKSTDVTRGVLDSFTEDGFSAFERSLGITPSYNQYYYGGKLLGDGIGVVGGGVTAGAGIIETGVFTAGGVTAVATPVSVTQIMAGSTLAVHSANNFEKNLTLFAKHNREKSEISTKFNFDEEAPYIRENRLPKDSETILSDGTFEKIGKVEPHGAQVYKKDNKYYYRDTLHYGKKAHLEVFDRRGNHLGEADPLTGKIKPHSVDSKKKLSKEYR